MSGLVNVDGRISHKIPCNTKASKSRSKSQESKKAEINRNQAQHSTICQPDDSHTFGRTFGGRPAREATDRRAQREPPWRQKFKLPPLRAERRRHLALVWENYGTRPTRYSRHPGDIPVGLDPQFSMSKKNNGRNPAVVNTADRVGCRTPWLNYSSVFAERNFITTISSATTTTP